MNFNFHNYSLINTRSIHACILRQTISYGFELISQSRMRNGFQLKKIECFIQGHSEIKVRIFPTDGHLTTGGKNLSKGCVMWGECGKIQRKESSQRFWIISRIFLVLRLWWIMQWLSWGCGCGGYSSYSRDKWISDVTLFRQGD